MPGYTKFLIGLALLLTITAKAADRDTLRELVIIHTNDFHGHIKEEKEYAGAARISAFVKQQRRKYPGVLFLDAGDAVSGTPVSTMYKGLPIFKVMNEMGYDIGTLGNHEFDHGYRHIAEFRKIANHPLLSANVYDSNNNLISDGEHQVLETNGIKIGIIGLTTDNTPAMVTPVGNDGLNFLSPEKVLRKQVAILRPKVDLLVVLSHVGHQEELLLAKSIPGIDIIVGGHSHTLVETPIKVGPANTPTYIAQAHRYGTHVGMLHFMVDTESKTVSGFSGKLVAAADLPEADEKVLAVVNFWEEKVESLVNMDIAISDQEISGHKLQAKIEATMASVAGADFGYYNIGGVRDKIPKGPVTARHIWNIEPFGNTLVTLQISGADYLTLLSRESEQHPSISAIKPGKTYKIATNSFIGAHAVKAFGDKVELNDLGVLIRDILIDEIKDNGV
jgi:2',3'-cyclic-nucleotide 2'-phosphodiesterase (5'-nucleotidase family)